MPDFPSVCIFFWPNIIYIILEYVNNSANINIWKMIPHKIIPDKCNKYKFHLVNGTRAAVPISSAFVKIIIKTELIEMCLVVTKMHFS